MAGGTAALQLVREAGLEDLVRPGSEHASGEVGSQRLIPVRPELQPLFPGGALRRGSVVAVATGTPFTDRPGRLAVPPAGRSAGRPTDGAVESFAESAGGRAGPFGRQPGGRRAEGSAVHPGATSLLLAVLAEASKSGSWCAVVGVPTLNAGAAAELGVVLDRLALVPNPGPDWPTVVAALLDGFDIVVAGPPGTIAPAIASRLAARARQRGAVLMPYGAWPAVDLTLDALDPTWHGIDSGRGRLRGRQLTVTSRGRGAASAPRLTHLWLPQPSGVLLPPTGELHPTAEPPPLRLAGTDDRPAPRTMAELRLAGGAPPERAAVRDGSVESDGEPSVGSGEALATVHRLSPGAWAGENQNGEAG